MASVQPAASRPTASFARRLVGALGLRGAAFESVEEDPNSIVQAAALVVGAGLARGVGAFASEGWPALLGSPVVAVVVWLACGVLIWGIGVRRFGYASDYPELLRTIAFAAAPLLLLAACALPLGGLVTALWIGAHAWATLALVVAVREALDVPLDRALLVCALALGVTLGLIFILGFLFVAGLA
ncbi:MAG: YIP1 family protein [Myxococcota bacterium]|nr:YIP1 family protein [Myxococcota bacterium]